MPIVGYAMTLCVCSVADTNVLINVMFVTIRLQSPAVSVVPAMLLPDQLTKSVALSAVGSVEVAEPHLVTTTET